MIVNGAGGRTTLVERRPGELLRDPSNGFLLRRRGDLRRRTPGDTYGFRLTGPTSTPTTSCGARSRSAPSPTSTRRSATRQPPVAGRRDASADARRRPTGDDRRAGEARWYRFPVVPGQNVDVDLTEPRRPTTTWRCTATSRRPSTSSADELDVTQLARPPRPPAHRARRPRCRTYPDDVQDVADAADDAAVHAVRAADLRPADLRAPIYAPRIYAPRIYAPRIYAPRIYAPDSFDPYLESDPAFQHAFSRRPEPDAARRVRQHRPQRRDVSASHRQHRRASSTSACRATTTRSSHRRPFRLGAHGHGRRRRAAGSSTTSRPDDAGADAAAQRLAETVIVTDTNKLALDEGTPTCAAYLGLARATWPTPPTGVVSTSRSRRGSQALREQVGGVSGLPLRRQPGRRRDQGHRRRLPQRRAASTS